MGVGESVYVSVRGRMGGVAAGGGGWGGVVCFCDRVWVFLSGPLAVVVVAVVAVVGVMVVVVAVVGECE